MIAAPADTDAAFAATDCVLIVPDVPVKPATESPDDARVPEVGVVNETVLVAFAVTVQVPLRSVSGETSDATVILVPTGYLAPEPAEVIVAAVSVRATAVIVEAEFEAAEAVVTTSSASVKASTAEAVANPRTEGTLT